MHHVFDHSPIVAVAADDALLVPVIKDADAKSLGAIARESRRLAERVRAGEVSPPELSGATFTVSNLGMAGMTAITAVVSPGQAAILGVGGEPVGGEGVGDGMHGRPQRTLAVTGGHLSGQRAEVVQLVRATQ